MRLASMVPTAIVFGLLVSGAGCGTPETAYATGQVVDTSGNPVSGAWVQAELTWWGCCDGGNCGGERQICGKTDANGDFDLSLVERRCEPGSTVSGIFADGFKDSPAYTPATSDYQANTDGVFVLYRCDEEHWGECSVGIEDADFDWCKNGTSFEAFD